MGSRALPRVVVVKLRGVSRLRFESGADLAESVPCEVSLKLLDVLLFRQGVLSIELVLVNRGYAPTDVIYHMLLLARAVHLGELLSAMIHFPEGGIVSQAQDCVSQIFLIENLRDVTLRGRYLLLLDEHGALASGCSLF